MSEPMRMPPTRAVLPERILTERRADAAAEARQHVIDLEEAIKVAIDERDAANNRVTIVEEANALLHERVVQLEHDCKRAERRVMIAMTKVHDAAGIIVSILKDPEDGSDVENVLNRYAPTDRSRLTAVAAAAERSAGEPEALPRITQPQER